MYKREKYNFLIFKAFSEILCVLLLQKAFCETLRNPGLEFISGKTVGQISSDVKQCVLLELKAASVISY